MSDKYIEKSLIYLVVASVALHFAAYRLALLLPWETPKPYQDVTTVDITDLPKLPEPAEKPAPPPPPKPQPQSRPLPKESAEFPIPTNRDLYKEEDTKSTVTRFSDRRRRVAHEMAPKGDSLRDKVVPPSPRNSPVPKSTARRDTASPPGPAAKTQPSSGVPLESGGNVPVRRGEGIFRSRPADGGGLRKLFPSAGKLARIEEGYRKKYGPEVAEGDAMFLNTDDIRFGSFLRRLSTAVYGVWRYPHEALIRGIEGTTPVRITFNRKGEVVQVELLESSGSSILDDEVKRTLNELGPIGSFPRGYTRETFKLIAFFHYGEGGERLR